MRKITDINDGQENSMVHDFYYVVLLSNKIVYKK